MRNSFKECGEQVGSKNMKRHKLAKHTAEHLKVRENCPHHSHLHDVTVNLLFFSHTCVEYVSL